MLSSLLLSLTLSFVVVLVLFAVGIKVFAEKFGWVGFVVVCFPYKINPKPTKRYLLWEKSGPNATFNLIFLGLGCPWVGDFVGFIKIFKCIHVFQPNRILVNRQHSNVHCNCVFMLLYPIFFGYQRRRGLRSQESFEALECLPLYQGVWHFFNCPDPRQFWIFV